MEIPQSFTGLQTRQGPFHPELFAECPDCYVLVTSTGQRYFFTRFPPFELLDSVEQNTFVLSAAQADQLLRQNCEVFNPIFSLIDLHQFATGYIPTGAPMTEQRARKLLVSMMVNHQLLVYEYDNMITKDIDLEKVGAIRTVEKKQSPWGDTAANYIAVTSTFPYSHSGKHSVRPANATVTDEDIKKAHSVGIAVSSIVAAKGLGKLGAKGVSNNKSATAEFSNKKRNPNNALTSKSLLHQVNKTPLWKNEINFQGRKVFQRDDLFSPTHIDANGQSNVERMASGRAPIGYDGEPVNLHHLIQQEPGSIAEVGGRVHSEQTQVLHIPQYEKRDGVMKRRKNYSFRAHNGRKSSWPKTKSGKVRLTQKEKDFNKWSSNYWQERAKGYSL